MANSDFLEAIKGKVSGLERTLVMPEPEDDRVLEAARLIQAQGLAKVILVGDRRKLSPARIDPSLSVVDPNESAQLGEYAEHYRQARPRTSAKVAEKLLRKPLFFAGMMVSQGAADAMVAGVAHPSARVLEASLMTVGLGAGIATPSSCFLMVLNQSAAPEPVPEVLVFADCALNVEPSVEELADIGVASAQTYQALMQADPRVAFLSFSTKGSANHAQAKQVAAAAVLAAKRMPDVAVDGELQLDAALSSRVAGLKVTDPSEVAGRANVLIFPNLAAGNLGYKLTQYLTGAQALGPLLQGLAAPVSDLSRGASVEDIVTTAALTLAQS